MKRTSLVIKREIATLTGLEMLVVCTSVGNPDHGQYTPLSDPEYFKVNSFEQAAAACRAYIQMWNLGGGNWSGGQIFTGAGIHTCDVSYNGRIWKAGKDFVNRAEIEIDKQSFTQWKAYYDQQYAQMLEQYMANIK